LQEVKTEKIPFGTREFAKSNINYMKDGCELNCKYCYGKIFALRFKRIKSPKEWKDMKPNIKVINANYRKRQGRIMFPSAHNITSNNFKYCIVVLEKLLRSRNEVLIVSKPEPDFLCILKLLKILYPYKSQVEFRFTITSNNNKKLKFWEPNASSLEDRLNALFITYHQGYLTSVNIEPYLDKNPIILIKKVAPFSSEVWLGFMNWINWLPRINPTLDQALLSKKIQYIKKISSWPNVQKIVENLKQLPEDIRSKIRFKDSIKRMYKKRGLEAKI